jgi:HlyD family secretion protein
MSKHNQKTLQPSLAAKVTQKLTPSNSNDFEQNVLLQQSPVWSRTIAWGIMGVTTAAIILASVAKIEEAIGAQGKLEPQAAVKEVQVPVGGVVKLIHVEEGQRVKKGDLLLSLDPTAAQAELASANKIRTALIQENQFYYSQLKNSTSSVLQTGQFKLSPELLSLTKSRAALVAENQLYRVQLGSLSQATNLSSEQRSLLEANQAELNSRIAVARLEIGQLQRQLSQNQAQLASATDITAFNRGLMKDIEPLVKEGALSRVQYLKQRQETRTSRAEVEQLTQERERMRLAIAQAQEQLQNTVALAKKDLLTKIAENEKGIAEIDSQLSKAIRENEKSIAEIDSQLSQTKLTLQYQELRASADGTIFDLQAHAPGFVANTSEPILKIVPNDNLVAKVFITNKDIGFVQENMTADVRIDSFPFSEFGDIKGRLVLIGSDSLPPTQTQPFYSFPAKVRLDQQTLLINGREVPLHSGMSVSVNIKVRSRTVMSIFTDWFTRKIESLKTV